MRPAFVVIDVVHIHAGARVLQAKSGEVGHIFGNDGIENIETDPILRNDCAKRHRRCQFRDIVQRVRIAADFRKKFDVALSHLGRSTSLLTPLILQQEQA